jgi:TolB-like protein
LDSEILNLNGASLDLGAGTLTRNGAPVALRARSFALLAHLARRVDRVVSKNDLMDAVWPDVTVTEDSLTQAVRDIRVALGDGDAKLLQTVRGRGYLLAGGTDAASASAAPAVVPRLAVVPFEDRTGQPTLAPVIDILCDEVATGLSRFRSLTVIARASVEAAQRLHPGDLAAIARALGASYVIEGVARRDGEGYLASIRLSEVETGAMLWSESFDCAGDRVLTLRDRVPQIIVGHLVSALETAGSVRAGRLPTASLTAFEHYARGLAELALFTPAGDARALEHFRKAVDADPQFGQAHTYCAIADLALNGYLFAPPEVKARALETARRGAALAPGDARCMTSVGFMLG